MASASGFGESNNCNDAGTSADGWLDVALTDKTQVVVEGCVKDNALLKIGTTQGFQNVDEQNVESAFKLEPGKAYKFRVAAVNSMGVGPWSQVATYQTTTPDRPPAPCPEQVKVCRTSYGAVILWDMPPNVPAVVGPIIEYGVFLSIKCGNNSLENKSNEKSYFLQFYRGIEKLCIVSKEMLECAAIDKSGEKHFIVFRIAARNKVGFGPATEVHWMQN